MADDRQTSISSMNSVADEPSGPFRDLVPEGDNRIRRVCDKCGYIEYQNPKLVVGAIVTFEDKFLICKRAIEPCIGKWTMPAGYLELEESLADGAAREVLEEAGARVEITGLLGVYDIPHIGQVHVMHKARMLDGHFAAGPESLDVDLVTWDELPWDNFAFPSVTWAFEAYKKGLEPTVTVSANVRI